MKKKFTLKDAIECMKAECKMFEYDFDDKEYGDKAKLLAKHYKRILDLLKMVK